MIGALSLLKHKPEHTVEQFKHHWRHVHGPLAADLHGVRRYVQSHFIPGDALTNAFARSLHVDGLAAISFDSEEDRSICYASRQEEVCDVDSLLFIGASARYVTAVEERLTQKKAPGTHKAVLLLTSLMPDLAERLHESRKMPGLTELLAHRVTAPGAAPTQARRQIDLPLEAILEVAAADRPSLVASVAVLVDGLSEGDAAVFAATAHSII